MKTDKRSIAIRASWMFGVLYVGIVVVLSYICYLSDNIIFMVALGFITGMANDKRKELRNEIRNN